MLAYGSLAWVGRRSSTRSKTSRSLTIPSYSSANSSRMREMVGSDCAMIPHLLQGLNHTRPDLQERLPRAARPPTRTQLGVDQLGQQLQAVHDPRARAAEIRVAIDRIHASPPHCR